MTLLNLSSDICISTSFGVNCYNLLMNLEEEVEGPKLRPKFAQDAKREAKRHKALLSTRRPCSGIEMLRLQLVYTSFPLFSSLKPPFS